MRILFSSFVLLLPLLAPSVARAVQPTPAQASAHVSAHVSASAATPAVTPAAKLPATPAGATRAASASDGAAAASAASIAAGQRVFALCASCHQIGGRVGAAFGPQLTGIVGRPAAATTDFKYSPAMKASHLVWTEQNLAAFIRDPKKVVPGTSMRFWGLSDERQIADLLAYLRSVK
ncbi:MAG: cytochrome c family protein [Massilia sp.]|nr:cytochrome c family protein [Massilia sp.]